MSAGRSTTYDTVAYPSNCCPQAHPDRLATLATLFGMSPAPVASGRVLELGCGEGRNLIAMAFALPDATFVGVDLAASAIARAREETQALGLANVEFHCADLLRWRPPGGPFDYVIAHGLLSWVPEAVCRRVFELCRDCLAPQGVVFVSYNALPGWHVRGMVREMMLFHTRHVSDPAAKIAQAKAFLGLLLAAHAAEGSPAALVKREAKRILDRNADAILFHDDLSEINRPFYFHELAALAGQHGLQFLAETDFSDIPESIYPPSVIEALKQLDENVVEKEQYLDFLRCRRFRQTLLCRDEISLKRELKPRLVRQLLIASSAKAQSTSPDLRAGVFEAFAGPGGTMQVDDPLTKAAIVELLAIWPRALPFGELLKAARRRLAQPAADGDEERLAEALLTAYSAVIELHVWQPPWTVGRPTLNALARWQLANDRETVTSLWHADIRVAEPTMRAIFQLLDGAREIPAVAAELGRRIDAGELALPSNAARPNLLADVTLAVRDAAAKGLLIAWDVAMEQ